MIKKLFLPLIILGGLATLFGLRSSKCISHLSTHESSTKNTPTAPISIEEIGKKYMDFLISFGKADSETTIDEMDQLFAPTCKKEINAQVVCESSPALFNQLYNAKQQFKSWDITFKILMASDRKRDCIILYDITTEALGTVTVIKCLRINKQGLIKSISEAYHKSS